MAIRVQAIQLAPLHRALAAVLLLPASIALCQAPTRTDELVLIAGVPSIVRQRTSDTVVARNRAMHVISGRMMLLARDTTSDVHVMLAATGAEDVLFVDRQASDSCDVIIGSLAKATGADGAHCTSLRQRVQSFLGSKPAAHGAMHAVMLPRKSPQLVEYLALFQSPASASNTLQLTVAANRLQPVTYSSTLELKSDAPSGTPMWPGTLSSLMGALIGGIATYAGFRAQQKFVVERDAEREFAAARIRRAAELGGLMTRYRVLARADGVNVADRWATVREYLLSSGLYAMLPVKEAALVDAYWKARDQTNLSSLDALLTQRFGTFLT